MTPEISEFTYGFALMQEVATLASLKAAPIFPSLIEEGKTGGGYDVNFDWAGIPVFLQFKRSDYMTTPRAIPVCDGAALSIPFFRFSIRRPSKSKQHSLLMALDVPPNIVFYVAPRLQSIEELNAAYSTSSIFLSSFFVAPKTIGALSDENHYVSFDKKLHFVSSEPRLIEGFSGEQVRSTLMAQLAATSTPFKETLNETLEVVEGSFEQSHSTADDTEAGRPKSDQERKLRRVADLALRYYNAQLVVFQNAADAP